MLLLAEVMVVFIDALYILLWMSEVLELSKGFIRSLDFLNEVKEDVVEVFDVFIVDEGPVSLEK